MERLARCSTRERAVLRPPSVQGSVYSFHQEQPLQGNTFASSTLPLLHSSDHKSQQSTPTPARQYFCEPPAQARKSYHTSECIQPDSGEELEEQKADVAAWPEGQSSREAGKGRGNIIASPKNMPTSSTISGLGPLQHSSYLPMPSRLHFGLCSLQLGQEQVGLPDWEVTWNLFYPASGTEACISGRQTSRPSLLTTQMRDYQLTTSAAAAAFSPGGAETTYKP